MQGKPQVVARRRFARASRQKGQYIWTVLFFESFNIPVTPISSALVADADWTGAAGRPNATLMSIRGWWAANGQTGTGGDQMFGIIMTKDEDVGSTDASIDPVDPNTYVDEDILSTFGWANSQSTESGVRGNSGMNEVNVKARRKIHAGTNVAVVLTTTNDEISFSGVFRALLKVG